MPKFFYTKFNTQFHRFTWFSWSDQFRFDITNIYLSQTNKIKKSLRKIANSDVISTNSSDWSKQIQANIAKWVCKIKGIRTHSPTRFYYISVDHDRQILVLPQFRCSLCNSIFNRFFFDEHYGMYEYFSQYNHIMSDIGLYQCHW